MPEPDDLRPLCANIVVRLHGSASRPARGDGRRLGRGGKRRVGADYLPPTPPGPARRKAAPAP